jgi:hypothetical protein
MLDTRSWYPLRVARYGLRGDNQTNAQSQIQILDSEQLGAIESCATNGFLN